MNCVKRYLAPHIKKSEIKLATQEAEKGADAGSAEEAPHQRIAPVGPSVRLGDTSLLNELSEVKHKKSQHDKLPGSSLPVCLHSDAAQ